MEFGEEDEYGWDEEGEEDYSNDTKFVAIIEYSINSDGEAFLDLTLDDFSPESVDKLSRLFASIPTLKFQLRAMEMVKEAFLSEDKADDFNTFVAKVIEYAKNSERVIGEKGDSDPIICPTKLTL